MKKFLLFGLLLSAPICTPALGMDWLKKSISSYYYTNDLHKAVKNGDAGQVELLLTEPTGAYDQQVSEQDQDGNTPLHLALLQGPKNNKSFHLIIHWLTKHNGLDIGINTKNNAGQTPLDLGIMHLAVKNDDCELVKKLLENPGCLSQANKPDQDGNTPLHLALLQDPEKNKNADSIIDILINKAQWHHLDIGVNTKNNAGQSPLHLMLNGPFNWMNQGMNLWQIGADITAQESKPEHINCFCTLMKKEVNRDNVLDLLKRPIEIDLYSKKSSAWKLNDGQEWPLTIAVQLKPNYQTKLFKIDWDITRKYQHGLTTLHFLAANDPELLEAFLTHPQTIYDIDILSDHGNTALHWAAQAGKPDAIATLLQHGASIDIKNKDGETPLDLATDETCIALLAEATKPKTPGISPEYKQETDRVEIKTEELTPLLNLYPDLSNNQNDGLDA